MTFISSSGDSSCTDMSDDDVQIVFESSIMTEGDSLLSDASQHGNWKNASANIYNLKLDLVKQEPEAPIQSDSGALGTLIDKEKIELLEEQLNVVNAKLKFQTEEITRLKRRNSYLEVVAKNLSAKTGTGNENGSSTSLANLRCQLKSLEQCFHVLLWKMEGQLRESKEGKMGVIAFREEMDALFQQVRGKLRTWEQNQSEMQRELVWTKQVMLTLNGAVKRKLGLSNSRAEGTSSTITRDRVGRRRKAEAGVKDKLVEYLAKRSRTESESSSQQSMYDFKGEFQPEEEVTVEIQPNLEVQALEAEVEEHKVSALKMTL